MKIEMIEPDLTGEGLRIAVVQARFNEDLCRQLTDACVAELESLGVDERDVLLMTVPGALELPVVLDRLAATGEFDALIALGCVVRGETYHFEVVSNESSRGISQVALNRAVPIANGVLTVETEAQALERVQEKGRDCARAAVEMANLCGALDEVEGEQAA